MAPKSLVEGANAATTLTTTLLTSTATYATTARNLAHANGGALFHHVHYVNTKLLHMLNPSYESTGAIRRKLRRDVNKGVVRDKGSGGDFRVGMVDIDKKDAAVKALTKAALEMDGDEKKVEREKEEKVKGAGWNKYGVLERKVECP